ncbi:hypothetical protein Y697_12060 [Mesotoga sp. BH458_6_3_2_1]|uniref:hypothetical protein n=1 Tax=Mesotoga sp. TaxID=2053577 RepID=UPI000EF17B8F|nr:hypothetical protein [Mesotoga sp.]MDD4825774.1 hypothetical protein [Mesotoga sp.]MDD5682471.1 hypothetical protein [Mesotoga sp.]RLL81468.1 hypothetical protein Y697_12060 [Mesotoga sp. BH458_6_3_2_1]
MQVCLSRPVWLRPAGLCLAKASSASREEEPILGAGYRERVRKLGLIEAGHHNRTTCNITLAAVSRTEILDKVIPG